MDKSVSAKKKELEEHVFSKQNEKPIKGSDSKEKSLP